jgi:hypothetical protein
MTQQGKPPLWNCAICGRLIDNVVMTNMWESGVLKPHHICNQEDCWIEAEARGYQVEPV